MKFKITKEFEDKDSGVCVSVVDTRLGTFIGHATCNEKDKEHYSRWFGLEIAYYRACKKAVKAEIKEVSTQIKALENYYKSIQSLRSYDNSNYMVRTLEHQIEELYDRRSAMRSMMYSYDDIVNKRIFEHDMSVMKNTK